MVAEFTTNNPLVKKVAELYEWLDSEISLHSQLAGRCDACGKCCDFESYDHRLFVTPPELIYLAANQGSENIKLMPTSLCPYNISDKCTIYKYRFAGCRIFCCKADRDFQSRLSESILRKFKLICTEFQIPHLYTDLPTALNSFSANTCRLAEGFCPEGP